jgi:carbon-monoxide dehydrogenase medium subunit
VVLVPEVGMGVLGSLLVKAALDALAAACSAGCRPIDDKRVSGEFWVKVEGVLERGEAVIARKRDVGI